MQPGAYYHVYNHANGDENLFRQDENYHYFLRLWAKYIEPIADTYAYCLMPNHFHALIRIKAEEHIRKRNSVKAEMPMEVYISRTFSNLFNAYAKAFNKMYDRRGSLFNRPFKAKEVNNDSYLTAVMVYIHRNPVHHGFCTAMEDWPFSSYHALLSDHVTKLNRAEALQWFSGSDEFKRSHRLEPQISDTSLFLDW